MAVNRSSTDLVRFFGAEVFATTTVAAIGNAVVDGNGDEKSISAALQRLQGQALEPAVINSTDFQIAVAFFERRGTAPLAAKAMGMVFLDIAKVLNTSVVRVLDEANENQIKVVEASAYKYINTLRDNTSQLTKTVGVNNQNSYRARYLLP